MQGPLARAVLGSFMHQLEHPTPRAGDRSLFRFEMNCGCRAYILLLLARLDCNSPGRCAGCSVRPCMSWGLVRVVKQTGQNATARAAFDRVAGPTNVRLLLAHVDPARTTGDFALVASSVALN